jgi:hypothetical protein
MRLTQNHTVDITHRRAIACCQAALRSWMIEEKALLACLARAAGAGLVRVFSATVGISG